MSAAREAVNHAVCGKDSLLSKTMRTAREGMWFVGAGFAKYRQYSKVTALQIKATEAGLLSKKP